MAFKTNFPGYTILNSKDHLDSCLSYTWMNTWFNAALVATFTPDSVRIHLPIHSSEAPDCGEDSLEQLTWCASRNSCMSSFRIFILKLEASSGLNHRLPNWEFKIINQGKVIRNTAIWKEKKKKTCLRSLLFFLRRGWEHKNPVPLLNFSFAAFEEPLQWIAPWRKVQRDHNHTHFSVGAPGRRYQKR